MSLLKCYTIFILTIVVSSHLTNGFLVGYSLNDRESDYPQYYHEHQQPLSGGDGMKRNIWNKANQEFPSRPWGVGRVKRDYPVDVEIAKSNFPTNSRRQQFHLGRNFHHYNQQDDLF